jgi:DNA (cytosine-5)-methyltransferase 1
MPLVLDFFCGAGGVSMGFSRAGFGVVGVDIEPQPNYPFEFIRGDALDLGPELLASGRFAAAHASCPCQKWAGSAHWHGIDHPDLIEPTRVMFKASGLPYVIENVPGAPLENPITLCGTMFGLGADGFELRRHRCFESNVFLMTPGQCNHRLPSLPVFGHGVNSDFKKRHGRSVAIKHRREAMGIDWCNRNELAEAIPPAYTEYIGRELIAHIESTKKGQAA